MEKLPDRRVFLRGAAGAVGMGAVGVFATKARFANASGKSVSSAPKPIPISTAGDAPNCQILLPPVVQRGIGKGKTLWKNRTSGKVTITFHIVPEGSATPAPIEINPNQVGGGSTSLDEGWYKYTVDVAGCGTIDPWLDIQ